jgi:hypothetical protein
MICGEYTGFWPQNQLFAALFAANNGINRRKLSF